MPVKLGQNFLINKSIAKKIIASANLSENDLVLEIGPGKGILTQELAKIAGKVVAVELDKELCKFLRHSLRNKKNVEIIQSDILKLEIANIIPHPAFPAAQSQEEKELRRDYKVVANLPYYITSPIIRMFLESELPPSEMILMMQKEVAERIVTSPGKMNILAVSVQYYAKPEILFYVGKENFNPVPEVDSAVVKITYHQSPTTYDKREIKKFFRVVKAGFCAKRKTLVNNLANSFHLDKKIVDEKIKAVGLQPNVRAQELGISEWKKLAKLF